MERVSRIYRFFSILIYPFLWFFLGYRVLRKKEDLHRYRQKLGIYKEQKPEGKLFWVNLASVGELNSGIKLIKILAEAGNVIVTSVTLTSYNEFKKKDFTGCRFKVFHQFSPLDSIICIKRFLEYFKPEKAIFVESEIWINMICETSKTCKLYLVNSRISPRSLQKWIKVKRFFVWLFNHFTLIFTSSKELQEEFGEIGIKNVYYEGNLKYDTNYRKPIDLKLTKQGNTAIFGSMHLAEMPILLPEIAKLLENKIEVILIPRHKDQVAEISFIFKTNGIDFVLRTSGEDLQSGKIYIADTMGESIDFYNFGDVIFIGGSLVDGIGGHNIIEPCAMQKPVLIGQFHFNCKEVVEEMEVIVTQNPSSEIINLLNDNNKREQMIQHANRVLAKYSGISTRISEKILS